MKKVLILMLGLVASTASFAHHVTTQPTAAQAHMLMTAEHKIKLYIQPLPTKAQLGIQDAHGQSVYSATVALQKGLSQQFDISGLGAGTYRFTISTGTETLTKTFVVQATPEASFVIQES